MKLFSKVSPPFVLSQFFPSSKQTTVLELGLQSLDPSQWLVIDKDWPAFYEHKKYCHQHFGDQCSIALPSSLSAQEEFSELLIDNLIGHHSEKYLSEENKIQYSPQKISWSIEDKTLKNLGNCIQEDICVLEKKGNEYQLTAGHVCSPSGWKLEEKIGKGLDAIHSPVPGYEKQLADKVNRLLEKIKPNKPILRFNWSLQYGNELGVRDDWKFINSSKCIEDGREENEYESHTKKIYWRVERQTLRRLPKTNAIVFSIRIFLNSLDQMAADSTFIENLKTILNQLPKDEINYKSLSKLKSDIELISF